MPYVRKHYLHNTLKKKGVRFNESLKTIYVKHNCADNLCNAARKLVKEYNYQIQLEI